MFVVSVADRKPLPPWNPSRNGIPGKNFPVEGPDIGTRKDFRHSTPRCRKSFRLPARSWGRKSLPSGSSGRRFQRPEILSRSPSPAWGARRKYREGFSQSGRSWKGVPDFGYLPSHASGNRELFSPCGKLVPSSPPSTTGWKSFPAYALGPSARSEKRTDPSTHSMIRR